MAIYPVIMCGGAGTRLWPASRPSRPKQFLPLLGKLSLFQDTVIRAHKLVGDGQCLIVVAGVAHETLVREQLLAIDVEAQIILEPAGRDSAPAMAAAALWTLSQDVNGVNVFVSSDHFLPDHDAFERAALEATIAAQNNKIVTLGVKPTSPSSAYGYIEPRSVGLSDVSRFVEKPNPTVAADLVQRGLLWNTGIFVVRSKFLIDELNVYQPEICSHVSASIEHASGGSCLKLTADFIGAPKISIDYAVMEKTTSASVLPVSFEWSDMGSWDAVAAKRSGMLLPHHILKDSPGSTIYSSGDCLVSVLGVENVAVVVEEDAVLVCSLEKSQEVKRVVDEVRAISPQHLDFAARAVAACHDDFSIFMRWVEQRALPLWATLGLRENGVFFEELTYDASPVACDLRLRVQARQCYVYAKSGLAGWQGPWRNIVKGGIEQMQKFRCGTSKQFQSLLTPSLLAAGGSASAYDIAFVIFALSGASKAGINADENEKLALDLLSSLKDRESANGAIVENGAHPHQSNVHMHLLEAALAWEAVNDGERWTEMSDRMVRLALEVFIDPNDGALREYFSSDWERTSTAAGKRVEPGHQFEWAWLLSVYAERRNDAKIADVAAQLYEVGSIGLWSDAGVMADAMDPSGVITERSARLWPQTEWARAALRFARLTTGEQRHRYITDAERALVAINRYLLSSGLWRDQLVDNDTFAETNAKASSFYHLIGVYGELKELLCCGDVRPD